MGISIAKQYSVFLPNKPGALNEFVKLFADQGVNIIGIASEIRDDSGVVRITVEGDKKIGNALTQAGFTTVETPVLSIEMVDKPGELEKLTKILGKYGINITTVYGTAFGGTTARMLISADDSKKAQEILEKELKF